MPKGLNEDFDLSSNASYVCVCCLYGLLISLSGCRILLQNFSDWIEAPVCAAGDRLGASIGEELPLNTIVCFILHISLLNFCFFCAESEYEAGDKSSQRKFVGIWTVSL